MEHLSAGSDDWGRLVERLGGVEGLTASARACGAFQRPRGVRTAPDLLRLALMYGPGGQSLRTLAAAAAADGVANVSDVALLNRLRGAGDWLEGLCRDMLAGPGGGPASDDGARGIVAARPIRLIDGSRLEGPGQRAWRLHLAYDPCAGRLVQARITPLSEGERLDRLAVQPGEIRIADRGFPQADGIRAALDARADILLRLTWNSLHLTGRHGHRLDWLALCARATAKGGLDLPVLLRKPRGGFTPIPLRLVLIRKPAEAAAQARGAVLKAARKDQRGPPDARTLACAEHLILLTSLSATDFSVSRLGRLYRVRWQIELAFKRLKSILHIDRLPAKDPRLARAWLHAHLLAALLVDDARAELAALSP